MSSEIGDYAASHEKTYKMLCQALPDGVGWACYEVILPKVNGCTHAWLKGADSGSLDPSDHQIARIAGAFANEQRVSLMRALDGSLTTFASLKEKTGMTAGRLQHHLKELALAGFLRDTRQRNHYELTTIGRALLQIMMCLGQWPPDLDNSEAILSPEQI